MPLIAIFALLFVVSCWAIFKWILLAFVLLVVIEGIKQTLHPESTLYVSPPAPVPSPKTPAKRKGRVVFAKEVRQVRNGKVVIIRPKNAKVLRFYVDG